MSVAERASQGTGLGTGVRPSAAGKFVYAGREKLYIRGVTYGTFRPGKDGRPYAEPEAVERDFAMIAASGVNAVRTYTVPPIWLLDRAREHGLRVLVGVPWEEHVTFLDDRKLARSIRKRVRSAVRSCEGHSALLGFAIGNEIPAGIVRWHGKERTERFIRELYQVAKEEDPEGLVTYVNYPSTEYLDLPFLDLVCFNVYLERQEDLRAYISRLQNIAGHRPLVMAEIGLDSRRNGEGVQAHTLDWQIRTAFASGCAGSFVFSWTDEWHRGGHEIENWDFGLTTRDRHPKLALEAVRRAFSDVPFPAGLRWPSASVIICSFNGERTIRDCLSHACALDYADFEIIVVDDGSTDRTAAIAQEYDVRLIRTENRGLSAARNVGLQAATGEIVAYIDDDAYPDRHWLSYLAHAFMTSTHVAVGGPNIPPPGDGVIADSVANAPGGPIHVLVSDDEAEHIPGCNMAFRREALIEIGGFDPRFRAAGDDVDVCWRLRERGQTLGFSPAAVVWHRRRNSIRTYWKQQCGYGKAEALLEQKWPEKYNPLGHVSWNGRMYGGGLTRALVVGRSRVYHGPCGSAPFQSLYEPAPGLIGSLPLMPEWHLLVLTLVALAAMSVFWAPLIAALPLACVALIAPIIQAVVSGARAVPVSPGGSLPRRLGFHGLTTLLHLVQPIARLRGRHSLGLTLWRARQPARLAGPWRRQATIWSEEWRPPHDWLGAVEIALGEEHGVAERGGSFDRWDLALRLGTLGGARILMAVEEHGGGRQLVRFRLRPAVSSAVIGILALSAAGAAAAAIGQAWAATIVLGMVTLILAWRTSVQCAGAMAAVTDCLNRLARAND